MGTDAGGHYNPNRKRHGYLPNDGLDNVHSGDFGNLTVDNLGNGTLEMTFEGLSLSGGMNSVAGRAVVIHQKADDFGQPTGNAGSRIAVGTIVISGVNP